MRHNLAENHIAQERQGRSAAFTLTELLVVIALTGLLLALILGPLVQGFRLTNRARALAEAQNATRFTLETLKRELSQAAYVFDNSNTPVVLPLDLPAPERDPAYYPVLNGNPNTRPQIAYAKIDFVPAATFGEGQGTAIDPTTNKPLGGTPIQVPVAPGTRIVRYFVGLRQNIPTGNATVADDDINPFILYRA
jgi:type II secretory pathway pseudopilin PulG